MSDPRPTSNPYAGPVPGTAGTGDPTAPRPGLPSQLGVKPDARLQQAFLTQAFLWMFIGLLVTAGIAFVVQGNEALQRFTLENFLLLAIGQLVLALGISWGINRISASVALGLFFVYAASLGLTIGLIVTAYTGSTVVTAFLSAAAMFGGAAIYGATTKRNLAGLGGILFMGLIGLIAASILNVLFAGGTLSFIISIVGVGLFTVLTAYDIQRIQNGDLAVWTGSMEKAAVLGALHLYLDFVNIFLFLLRLFGSGDD